MIVVEEESGDKEDRDEYKWKKWKKTACMLSFSGKDYMGMQSQRSQGKKPLYPSILFIYCKIIFSYLISFPPYLLGLTFLF